MGSVEVRGRVQSSKRIIRLGILLKVTWEQKLKVVRELVMQKTGVRALKAKGTTRAEAL